MTDIDCFKYGFVLLEDSSQSSKFIYIARAQLSCLARLHWKFKVRDV